MVIGGRIGRVVAASFAGHLAVLGVAVALLALGLAPVLAGLSLRPSPWVLGGPLAVLAAWWTAHRIDQTGEAVAISAGGMPRSRVALPAVAATVLLQLVLCVPGVRPERSVGREGTFQAVVGVGGELLVAGDQQAFFWAPDATTPVAVAPSPGAAVHLPRGFVPEPRDRTRVRRQLFLVGTPLTPTGHPLDPGWVRWLWLLAGAAGVLIALGAERAAVRWLGLVPLLVAGALI